MADSESGASEGASLLTSVARGTGVWQNVVVRDANWSEKELKEFFGDIQYEADQIYLDNVSEETITSFHHEGRTRTLTKQELIDLLWGNDNG